MISGPVGDVDTVRRNLDLQREYYGELFGERARRLVVGFDISQAQLAEVLGISAPMLSQVMSGRRQKLANPAALARLVLLERSLQTAQGYQERRDVLAEVRGTTSTAAVLSASTGGRQALAQGLRECCESDTLAECAQLVGSVSPNLAQLLTQAAGLEP